MSDLSDPAERDCAGTQGPFPVRRRRRVFGAAAGVSLIARHAGPIALGVAVAAGPAIEAGARVWVSEAADGPALFGD